MLLKINLARNSLRYIIRTYNIKVLHLPYYLCNTVRSAILKENCKPVFYHIDDNFLPSKEFFPDDFILYPNYFGICDENVKLLADKYPKLIVDNAHSFYSEPKGFACFNSARKFLPVYNGSYLWIKDLSFNPQQIISPLDYDIKCENSFDNLEVFAMSDELDFYIKSFDIKEKRKEIFLQLHEKYGKTNILSVDTKSESPFCYPYLAKTPDDADALAQSLSDNGQIIYRYWNNLPKSYNEYKYYRRLVPIPVTIW